MLPARPRRARAAPDRGPRATSSHSREAQAASPAAQAAVGGGEQPVGAPTGVGRDAGRALEPRRGDGRGSPGGSGRRNLLERGSQPLVGTGRGSREVPGALVGASRGRAPATAAWSRRRCSALRLE